MNSKKKKNLKPKAKAKTKVKVIPRAKYDWAEERQEFFESRFQDAKAYFESKYGRFDGNMSKRSRGWAKDKRAWRLQEVQIALQNLQTDRVLSLKKTNDDIVSLAEREINYMKKTGKINVKNLIRLWELIRTESGLPKSISHNINDNTNIDLASARESLVAKVNKATPKK